MYTYSGHRTLALSAICKHIPDMALPDYITARIAAAPTDMVWTPIDFLDLAPRAAVEKALQRLTTAGTLRRIARGLYDRPGHNRLTDRPTTPDYRRIVDALARRDQTRMLIDGMTAANDLRLTDAVPGRVVVHTDARRRTIRLGNLEIEFKLTAPSRLHWAGRPAMRVVQALHWLKDLLPSDSPRIVRRLREILDDPTHGPSIRADLADGLPTLPEWMQVIVRELFDDRPHDRSDEHSADYTSDRPAAPNAGAERRATEKLRGKALDDARRRQ